VTAFAANIRAQRAVQPVFEQECLRIAIDYHSQLTV
jgi:hypothetical protein